MEQGHQVDFTLSPWVALHWFPVFSIRETELRNDSQLIFCLPHELKAPLQLQHNKRPDINTFPLFTNVYTIIVYYYVWESVCVYCIWVWMCFNWSHYCLCHSAPDLRWELLRDLRQIVCTTLWLLKRHNQEIFKQFALVQVLLQRAVSAVGAIVLELGLVWLIQYGLNWDEALAVSWGRGGETHHG